MKQTFCCPRKPKKVGICDREPVMRLDTYDDIIDDYIRRYRNCIQAERQFFKNCSFRKAIRYAGQCLRSDGKRHGHHRRRSEKTLVEVERLLQACTRRLRPCDTFDELHERIHREIHPINDVGPLLVYDAAITIGAHLGLSPDRIYLHSGTAEGAKAVLRVGRRKTIKRSELPSAFMRLRCYEVEDCLCIHKGHLAQIAGTRSRRSDGRPRTSR